MCVHTHVGALICKRKSEARIANIEMKDKAFPFFLESVSTSLVKRQEKAPSGEPRREREVATPLSSQSD